MFPVSMLHEAISRVQACAAGRSSYFVPGTTTALLGWVQSTGTQQVSYLLDHNGPLKHVHVYSTRR